MTWTEPATEPLSTHIYISSGTPGGGMLGPGQRTLSAEGTFLSILGGGRVSSVLWLQPLHQDSVTTKANTLGEKWGKSH